MTGEGSLEDAERVKKLLAIVDDWEKLEVYETRLSPYFEVHCAPFGSYGIQMARESTAGHRPDLILIDLVFEDMNEFEADAILAADPELSSIPRVLITDAGSAAAVRQESARSQFISRPYDFNELLRILQRHGTTEAKPAP